MTITNNWLPEGFTAEMAASISSPKLGIKRRFGLKGSGSEPVEEIFSAYVAGLELTPAEMYKLEDADMFPCLDPNYLGVFAEVEARFDAGKDGVLPGVLTDDGEKVPVDWETKEPSAINIYQAAYHLQQQIEGRQLAEQRIAAKNWAPPKSSGSLAEQLAIEDPEVEYFVESLADSSSNVLLTAQYKAGKTTLLFNLAKCAVDNVKFLDQYKVSIREGSTVAYFNFELEQREAKRQLADMNIEHPERIYIEHLKGQRFSLPSPVTEAWAVSYLKSRNVSLWIMDPFAAAFEGEENSNSEVREWCKAIDRIKLAAGVDVMVLATHTGGSHENGFRARGATRLNDWVDVFWNYRHGGDGVEIPPDNKRWLRAFGRGDVNVAELSLDYNVGTRWMSVDEAGESRSEAGTATLAEKAELIVKQQPAGERINGGDLREAMGCTGKGRAYAQGTNAIKKALDNNWITCEKVGVSKLYGPGSETSAVFSWSAKTAIGSVGSG
jgi:hypothetical protein